MAVIAAPADLDTPVFRHVSSEKGRYAPGESATVTVLLQNATGSPLAAGSVTCDVFAPLKQIASPDAKPVAALAVGASATVSFVVPASTTDFRGYFVSLAYRDGSGAIVDEAGFALDTSSDPAVFPRYFALCDMSPGRDNASAVARQTGVFHGNMAQFYQVEWKHHIPFNPASTFFDLADNTISADTLRATIAACQAVGVPAYLYGLWCGAYADAFADGSGVKPEWAAFDVDPRPALAEMDMQRTPPAGANFPASWSTPFIVIMDPANPDWRAYIGGQYRKFFAAYPFDGFHVDTLGTQYYYDATGAFRSFYDALAEYTRFSGAAVNKPVVINCVSSAGDTDVNLRGRTGIIYEEKWSESTGRYYPSINAAAANIRRLSSKGIVFPGYMHNSYPGDSNGYGDIHYGQDPTVYQANLAGLCYAEDAFHTAGVHHMSKTDDCVEMTNTYWRGSANFIGVNAATKQALIDRAHWAVGHQELLRRGVVDDTVPAFVQSADQPVTANGIGAAGTVWLVPKSKAGAQILHLHNFTAVPSIDYKDVGANYPAPPLLTNLVVKMYFYGNAVTPGVHPLWWSSPDERHGRPQTLAYTTGSDAGGTYVLATLPRLLYRAMMWLRLPNAGDDFEIDAAQGCRGGQATSWSDGAGVSQVNMVGLCAGGWALYPRFQFKTAAWRSLVAGVTAPGGGMLEVRQDGPTGTLLCDPIALAASPTEQVVTPPLIRTPSGLHPVCLRAPGRKLNVRILYFGL